MRGKGKKLKISCKERTAFLLQRWGARKDRGIEFHFTYEEWVAWWKHHLGPDWFKQRGRASGQYVMARKGDKGPYAPWNVKCVDAGDNVREGVVAQKRNRGNVKLTEKQVERIHKELQLGNRGTVARLAREHGVNEATIRDIKNRLTWTHITKK